MERIKKRFILGQKFIYNLLSYNDHLGIMVNIVCKECVCAGNKAGFEEHGAYCKECLSEHAVCPKCGTPYHSASRSQIEKVLKNNACFKKC